MPTIRKSPACLKLTDWALEKRLSADLSGHVTRARADIEAFKKAMPQPYPFVYGLEDEKEPSDLKVFVRGNPYAFGEDAPRAFPSIFTDGEPKRFDKGSGRLELAEVISKEPITSRVVVNRIWRWHMGRGIVDTPNNFGMAGERPTNPELLEYLAAKFVAGGMSWKKLDKEILMSRTYQLSSATVEANLAKDPGQSFLLARQPAAARSRRHLGFAAVGVGKARSEAGWRRRPRISAKRWSAAPSTRKSAGCIRTISRRRSISRLPTISAERRYTTNVPQQRLFFLNNAFVHKQAEELANRIKAR